MKLPATPPEEASVNEEDLDEMSAMSTGAVVTSPKKEPLEENGWDEPVSWPEDRKWPGRSKDIKRQKARKKANQKNPE